MVIRREQSHESRLDAAPPRQPDDRFRRVLDAAPDAILVVDGAGRIELANAQAAQLFGYSPAQLLEVRLADLVPERFRAAHDLHLARFFESPAVRPMGAGIELYGRHRSGEDLPIEVSLSPLGDADCGSVVAIVRDVSERRRAREALRRGDERLRVAIESFPDAFALFSPTRELVLANEAYRALMADDAEPLSGRPRAGIMAAWLARLSLDAPRREALATELERRWHESVAAIDVRAPDGTTYRVATRRTPDGGIVETIWDLTDDARREDELRRARVAAEAGSAAKTEFLASMSHELRTPLNAILGFAQLMTCDRREPPSDRQRPRLEQIQRGGEHLLRLIDDVLDLARIESGAVSFSAEPTSCLDVVRHVVTTLGGAAARAKLSLSFAAATEHLPLVRADRTRFIQILTNFGSNAIKYNREGGFVRFDIEQRDDRTLRVRVTDNGIGIPLDRHDKIFQPFQRAGQETGPIEGTGIGLSITRRLAEMMGSHVGFRSVPSEGSEFWIDMPITDEVAAAPDGSSIAHVWAPAPATGAATLVLYVEDNPANLLFMRDLMDSFDGIELIAAPTAEIGIELARARLPDLVLLDINLPGMNGFEALRALQSMPETRRIPVVALTAAASARDREKGERAGFYRYLTKPIRIADIEATLESLRDGRASGKSATE